MIDIALFGLGRIGIMHGKNLMRNREFNLKYIYDIDKNLSKKYSKILKSIAVNSPSEIFKAVSYTHLTLPTTLTV